MNNYFKPTLKNLSQGARLEYAIKLRYMSKDDVADYFELGGERKERADVLAAAHALFPFLCVSL